MNEILGVFLRWVHVTSAIALVGGVLYARCIQKGMSDEAGARFRRLAIYTIVALLASGTYNLLNKASTPPPYHAVFGVKVLLALHVFAVALLLGKPGAGEQKRQRWMTGIAISGLLIVMLSAYLRMLS